MEISEQELNLALEVFEREWAKIYPEPCNHPGKPLGHAIEAVLASRGETGPISAGIG